MTHKVFLNEGFVWAEWFLSFFWLDDCVQKSGTPSLTWSVFATIFRCFLIARSPAILYMILWCFLSLKPYHSKARKSQLSPKKTFKNPSWWSRLWQETSNCSKSFVKQGPSKPSLDEPFSFFFVSFPEAFMSQWRLVGANSLYTFSFTEKAQKKRKTTPKTQKKNQEQTQEKHSKHHCGFSFWHPLTGLQRRLYGLYYFEDLGVKALATEYSPAKSFQEISGRRGCGDFSFEFF